MSKRVLKSRTGTTNVPSTETLELDCTVSGAAVETDLSSSASSSKVASAAAVKTYVDNKPEGYNYVINGDMRISQRGDFSTTVVGAINDIYYLDRWKTSISDLASFNLQHTDVTIEGIPAKATRLTATANATGGTGDEGRLKIWQPGEQHEQLAGKVATLSAWVRSNNTASRILLSDGIGNTTSNPVTSVDTWEKLVVTRTMSTSASSIGVQIGIIAASNGRTSIANGNYVEFADVKLEIGSVATPFVPRLYAEELALCQRYFVTLGGQDDLIIATGQCYANNSAIITIRLPVEMYATPTVDASSSSSSTFAIYSASLSSQVLNSLSYQSTQSNNKVVCFNAVTTNTNQVAGDATLLKINNVGGAIFNLIAEL